MIERDCVTATLSGTLTTVYQNLLFATGSTTLHSMGGVGWRRVSTEIRAFSKKLTRRPKLIRRESEYVKFEPKRTFLKYAFVWTGQNLQGFLVHIDDLNLCTVYEQCPETAGLAEATIFKHAKEMDTATEMDLPALIGLLKSIWNARTKNDFDQRLILHLIHLEEWRKSVRTHSEAEESIERNEGVPSLLELGEEGQVVQRSTFCNITTVSARRFDFRPNGYEQQIGWTATEAEDGIEISCAAMIVLMQLEDTIGNDHALCAICNQMATDAKKILVLRTKILNKYS